MPKIKPNELCPCGSGSKYKKCCIKENNIITKYSTGQLNSSEVITTCINILTSRYKNSLFINVTDDLTEDTYKEYQLKNWNNNIVMIAEKTENNKNVFATRINEENSDIIIFHKGSFRTFYYKNIERVLESIKNLI